MNQQINNENPVDMRVREEFEDGPTSRLDLVSRSTPAQWVTSSRAGLVSLGLAAAMWLSMTGGVIAQGEDTPPAETPSATNEAENEEEKKEQPALPPGYVPPGVIPEGASSDDEWIVELGKDEKEQRRILARFRTEMIRQGMVKNEEDRKLFVQVVRWKLSQFTLHEILMDPDNQQEISRVRREIFRDIDTARDAGTTNFNLLMQTLIAEIPELFKYHFIARLNGAWLLAELNEEEVQTGARPRPAVPYAPAAAPLLALLKQPQQLEAVRRPAVIGLSRIYANAQIPLDLKNEIVATFLDELENGKPTNDILPSKIAEELGLLGVMNDNTQRPRGVQVLTQVLADQRRPYRVRCECAQALGRLPLDNTINVQLIAHKIVELASQMVEEMQQGQKKAGMNQAFWKSCFWELYVAFKGDTKDNINIKQHGLSNKRIFSPALKNSIRTAYEQVRPVVIAVLRDMPIEQGQLPAMQKWLQESAPANKRIHDSFKEIISSQALAKDSEPKSAD